MKNPTSKEQVNYADLGFYRLSAVSPTIHLGRPKDNANLILEAAKKQSGIVTLFPELSLTGYTIEDYFQNDELLAETKFALSFLREESKKLSTCLIVGAPFPTFDGRLFNTAFVIAKGKILGAVPKIHLPNAKEFYEKRWFSSGSGVSIEISDPKLGNFILSSHQLFKCHDMIFGIEICEDLFAPIKPSQSLALNGANVIFNPSASPEQVGKSLWRKDKIKTHSGDLHIAYIYASSGPWESSKDLVYSGHLIAAENGEVLKESRKFSFSEDSITIDIDVKKLLHERRVNTTFSSAMDTGLYSPPIEIEISPSIFDLERVYSKTPFIPDGEENLSLRSQEIFQMLSTALARRVLGSQVKNLVIGLSGGLDSTLTLLISIETLKILKWKKEQILGITMPGPGTTEGTLSSAKKLAKFLGISFDTISIKPALSQHLKDIKQNEKSEDVTFENAQARERTQILFDKANQINGLVVGTGDMSELWLGFCTYNADQMSSYHINGSVPKTLVKHLITWYQKNLADKDLVSILETILSTPISPELLSPGKKGEILQKTEEKIGPYILHDFFLFYHLRNGFGPKKILALAKLSFKDDYSVKEIEKWLNLFFERGYKNQFKRTSMPGSPKIGSVSLSPRGDLRLPDEMEPFKP